MDRAALDEMVSDGRLERLAPNSVDADDRRRNAEAGLATAEAILSGRAGPVNGRAVGLLAWDAALDVLLGWLSFFGYRITSERGHHVTAVRAVRALLLSQPAAVAAIEQLDGLRRLRDSSLYNNLPIGAEDVQSFLPEIARLCEWLGHAVHPPSA